MKRRVLICFTICASFGSAYTFAQQVSKYNNHEVFQPLFYPYSQSVFRTNSGVPGEQYWQNQADYKIDVILDTVRHTVSGTVVITYTNNSPNALAFLWLQLDQNIYKTNSRGASAAPIIGGRFSNRSTTNGFEIYSINIVDESGESKANYLVDDTRMQLRLKRNLSSKSKIKIKIGYAFTVPEYGTDRMGRMKTKNGWIYQIAQWYPRMCVYDDIEGWNTLPYLGAGEFYLEYGNIDFTISAPADLIIAGAGELQNAAQVLNTTIQSRLEKAKKSDRTVVIRDLSEITNSVKSGVRQNLSWHFSCKNTRDVSWAASKAFIWDAARVILPSGRNVLAQSFYPEESSGEGGWKRSTEFVKGCIEIYSRQWGEYIYPVASNVAGNVNGIEYPSIVFCSYGSRGRALWNVINHEFGHNWFPMMVGSNERKYAWMDEGFNTFINGGATEIFNNGEFYRRTDIQRSAPSVFGNNAEAIITPPDILQNSNLGTIAYTKPALGLQILRNRILGHERFDYAFKNYIKTWMFRHPTPWDFFHYVDNASGEDLSWFWKEWFFTTWKLDQSVSDVKYVDNDPKKGALITLQNLEEMALPVEISLLQESGKTDTLSLPGEIWHKGNSWTIKHNSESKIAKIILNPSHELPDINPDNNVWVESESRKVPSNLDPKDVLNNYLLNIGGIDRIKTMEKINIISVGDAQGMEIDLNIKQVFPNKYQQEIFIPSLNSTPSKIYIDGDSVIVYSMSRRISLTQNEKDRLRENLSLFPEVTFLEKSYKVNLSPSLDVVDGNLAYKITFYTPAGSTIEAYYDSSTGFKVKQITEAPNTPTLTEEFNNYKKLSNGIWIPFYRTTETNSQITEFEIKQVKINGDVSEND